MALTTASTSSAFSDYASLAGVIKMRPTTPAFGTSLMVGGRSTPSYPLKQKPLTPMGDEPLSMRLDFQGLAIRRNVGMNRGKDAAERIVKTMMDQMKSEVQNKAPACDGCASLDVDLKSLNKVETAETIYMVAARCKHKHCTKMAPVQMLDYLDAEFDPSYGPPLMKMNRNQEPYVKPNPDVPQGAMAEAW